MALTNKLTAIADAIREKTGTTDPMTLDAMPTAISGITTGSGGGEKLPAEALTITGNCSYRFANNGWNWFIENYRDRITTNNITNASHMFDNSRNLTEIPFDINFKSSDNADMSYMFCNCYILNNVQKINNARPSRSERMFEHCRRLRNISDDLFDNWDWTKIDSSNSSYDGNESGMFYSCYSLRSVPLSLLTHGNPYVVYSYSIYSYGFNSCNALDEIVNLPNPHLNATWTSNAFSGTFDSCNRLKNMTFATQEDGTPYSVNWKSQIIDLASYVGYAIVISSILNYNSGITADKEVKDDATYQALKDDPDWFTFNVEYSRYNHDSAVATINSLPDTSAYLASAGGTNTIKFKGAAGSATDGGAINTLTEEEIAVATAKGWTVSLV